MPLDEGYEEIHPKGKERPEIDPRGKERPEIDPRIPPVAGSKISPLNENGRVKDLKSKFFPGV